jgi:hypothetical protein
MPPPRPHRKYLSRTPVGRYSKYLPDDIAEDIAKYADIVDDTSAEEAMVRWMLEEFVGKYTRDEYSLEQLYTSFLVGLKTISEAIAKRLESKYKKDRLITPEQLVIIFRLIGDVLDKRISDPRERQLAAMDIAALVRGQSHLIYDKEYGHPQLAETSAVAIIDDAVP